MTANLSPEQKADEVIQADRDLFNLLFHIPAIRQREVNDGSRDYTEEMQAIARHRISSRTIAIEECAAKIRVPAWHPSRRDEMHVWREAVAKFRVAIRSLKQGCAQTQHPESTHD